LAIDLAQFNNEAIEQIFQGNDTIPRGVTIRRKERLKGLVQWIRNKSGGNPNFTLRNAVRSKETRPLQNNSPGTVVVSTLSGGAS
jgi:hypothetical protein